MALILLIETSTSVCSVALSRDGQLLSYHERNEPNIHASQLTPFIELAIKEAKVKYADLTAVAVSKGPGSYTGLRIGVSTAKGLCFALNIPLIAVDTLTAMASGFVRTTGDIPADTRLCPMIDARRMEVYLSVLTPSLEIVEPVHARILDERSFDGYEHVILFGDGAQKCRDLYASQDQIQIADFMNSARYLAYSAFEKFERNDFEDVAYFEPFYLKDFVAGKPKAS